ncbi:MAG: hypothetical protein SNF68_03305 [Rikenellaceae bacterium]
MKRSFFLGFTTTLCVLLLSLLTTSCEKTIEDVGVPTLIISPSTKQLTFDAEGSQIIGIEANRSWKAFFESTVDWATLSKSEGTGDDFITVSVASGSQKEATLTIALYNQVGIMLSEQITITRNSDGTVDTGMVFSSILFDGSELASSYPTNETYTVGGAEFNINGVANFSSLYETSGAIQFKASSGACIYNITALAQIGEIKITLAPAGTPYNNFTVYAGTTENPSGTAIVPTQDGDVCTYTLPSGSISFSINNPSSYTAYASAIEIISGEGTTVDPDVDTDTEEEVDPTPDPEVDGGTVEGNIIMDGSELPTSYPTTDTTITVDGCNLTIYNVANFTTIYDTSTGPIQFKASGSYIYNTTATESLSKVIITLSNSYNNFTVYAGAEQNPTEEVTANDYTCDAGVEVTYEIPAGCTYFSIKNDAAYTAYANQIEIVNVAE